MTHDRTARRARRALRTLAVAIVVAAAIPAAVTAQSDPGGTVPTGVSPVTPTPGASAFNGNGMWIWVMSRTYGGNIAKITAKARANNIGTLFIKSGDGVSAWKQFSPQLVSALHAQGFRVCGWQYVYGSRPLAEAYVSARAKAAGADCFAIDAESEYEGRYRAADQYVTKLRALVGPSFPISLAGFPYVDYHPAFPYSVFLAPGGAQYNQPQMYWQAIGTSVDQNFAHTYVNNRLYKRAIYPLGQTYDRAPPAQVRRFRQVARAYGAGGVSWWVWQETLGAAWTALSAQVAALSQYRPASSYPRLPKGARGDQVVWAQQLLYGAGQQGPIDGVFGAQMAKAVKAFQAAHGLPATGALDNATWPVLLRSTPARVHWRPYRRGVKAYVAHAAHRRGAALSLPAPRSASLPAVRREIPRHR